MNEQLYFMALIRRLALIKLQVLLGINHFSLKPSTDAFGTYFHYNKILETFYPIEYDKQQLHCFNSNTLRHKGIPRNSLAGSSVNTENYS